MPGAASPVAGGAQLAATSQSVYLPAGTHTIKRVDDLVYCPIGLSDGQAYFGGNVYTDSNGASAISWANDDFNTLDYYGNASFTGAPSFTPRVQAAGAVTLCWLVPQNHTWTVSDVTHGAITVSSTGDITLQNKADIGGSETTINTFHAAGGTYLRNMGTGDSDRQRGWRQYLNQSDGTKSGLAYGYLLERCPGNSVVFLERVAANEAGDQFLHVRLHVIEKPTIVGTISLDIPGRSPVVGGVGGMSFTTTRPEIITWTPSISGMYEITGG